MTLTAGILLFLCWEAPMMFDALFPDPSRPPFAPFGNAPYTLAITVFGYVLIVDQ